jgi:hypothetical protein
MKRTLAMVAIILIAQVVHAQDAAQKWPGLATSELSTVYVLDVAGTETHGKLVRLNSDSIVLLIDGTERQFDLARIKRVQKRGDSVRNGAIIGALIGGLFGGLGMAISDCPGGDPGGHCAGYRVAGFVISTAAYTAIGAGIDSLVVGRTTLYAAPPPGRSALRAAPGAPAFVVTFRW